MSILFHEEVFHIEDADFIFNEYEDLWLITVYWNGRKIGLLEWDDLDIKHVEVGKLFRRKGVATKMLNLAREMSQNNWNVPEPKHSSARTHSGDMWAKSFYPFSGEGHPELPRKSDEQYLDVMERHHQSDYLD